MRCRTVSKEAQEFFATQTAVALQCVALPPAQLTPLRPVLTAQLAQVVQRYSEDPASARKTAEIWLRVLDSPDDVVRVIAPDLLPPEAVTPDMMYLRARALTQRDKEGPLPIPGVSYV
jgi:hypothetical protein